ncbi:abortive infection system antitoxin AbiGi family protein [Flavobacterium sp. IB48]|uniref:abortive infection system antitoxin AbiGi family protein n=1 Tax=Flavobacterium sp. IB48 TaxID=2779375 RepID=UPI0018E7C4EA|nr:abortive infection system antitoxin AbiGi family protein [Flavobacterium sp. IB48]MBJ2125574.1 hypothetical protein [Flavobacterium sp. IB48]
MAISTNSVIHYTNRIDNLKGIISQSGFRLKYCLEEVDILSNSPFNVALPMISFCDIPLSGIKNHIDAYGSYGIGLTKNWAKENGVNPVLYLERKSKISTNLRNQGQRLVDNDPMDMALLNEFAGFLSYCKNYEGRLVRGKINTDSYRFYDEREWRFIADENDINGQLAIINGEDYLKDKDSHNAKIKDCYVKFSYDDISYIIVDNENEIPEILNDIHDAYEDIATAKKLKILATKILTKNQIWNDF